MAENTRKVDAHSMPNHMATGSGSSPVQWPLPGMPWRRKRHSRCDLRKGERDSARGWKVLALDKTSKARNLEVGGGKENCDGRKYVIVVEKRKEQVAAKAGGIPLIDRYEARSSR